MNSQELINLGADLNAVVRVALGKPFVRPDELLSGKNGKALIEDLRACVREADVSNGSRLAGAIISITRGDALRHVPFAESFRPTTIRDTRLYELERLLGLLADQSHQHAELAEAEARLRNWANFVELYRITRFDENQLLGFLKTQAPVAITACMTLAEAAFATARNEDTTSLNKNFDDLSPENVASGASYALESYARFTKLTLSNGGRFTNAFPCSRFRPWVFVAYQLREILDAEADVFRAGYRCLKSRPKSRVEFEILPPDERFGQALGHGYWLSSVMPIKNEKFVRRPDALPFRAVVEGWIKQLNDKLASFEGEPGKRRLVMKFPVPLLKLFGEEFIEADKLFAEEAIELGNAAMELQWPMSQLLDFELQPGLRVFDVLKIHRVLRLIAASRMACLVGDDVPTLDYWNSLVAGLTLEHLKSTLTVVGISSAAVEQWLGTFVWRGQTPAFLDLQYTPAVQVDEVVAVASAVAASSNYVRNAMVSCRTRPWANDDSEMILFLKSAFDGLAGPRVWPSVQYGTGEESGEVDCLVLWGQTLFAFECKKSLLPCSAFERRTTIDYIQDAGDQLSRFETYWASSANREELSARMESSDLRNAALQGCIVLSHRLLSGAQWESWPIRQIAGLYNFIRDGETELTFGDMKVAIPMRTRGECSVADFLRYLEPEAPHMAPIWRSMQRNDEVMKLNGCIVRIPHYGLNLPQFMCELGIVPRDMLVMAKRVAELTAERSRMGRLDDHREDELEAKGSEFMTALKARLGAGLPTTEGG